MYVVSQVLSWIHLRSVRTLSGSIGDAFDIEGPLPGPSRLRGRGLSNAQLWTHSSGLPVPSSDPLMYQFFPRGSASMVLTKSKGA